MRFQVNLSIKTLIIWLILMPMAPLFFNQSMAYAEEARRLVSAIGTASIPQNNVASGRQQAVSNGLTSIVYQAVAGLLPLDALSDNFQVLVQTFYSQPNQFIQDFKVQVETKKGPTYYLIVEATVSMDRLSDKLKNMGILKETKIIPKVLYLISEKLLEDPSPKTWWSGGIMPGGTIAEPSIIQALTNSGFDYFDPGPIDSPWQLDSQISDRKAQSLGTQLGTELVLIGTTVAGLAPNTMDGMIQSYLGTVDLHIVSTTSGEVLARSSQSAISANVDPVIGQRKALTLAAEKAAKDIANQVATVWLRKTRKKQQLEILISGISGKIAQLVQFRRVLNEINGVHNLQMKEMTSLSATLLVNYKGPAQGLAEELMVKSFNNFGINIYQVDPSGIKLELVKEE
jgi:hypothetical protein